jgi:DNA uptake protein ComE-like DNA-binding protein
MGGQVGIQNGGMVDYSGAKPPYRCRFGPIDSIDELLLVQGVTPDLLYGTDKVNRNGIDDDGDKGGSAFNRGWSTFLTVHSREQNCAPDGSPYIYLNNTNLKELYDQLVPEVGDEMAKFIVMCRKKNWKTGVPDPTKLDSLTNYTVDTTANVGGTDYKFKTLFDLVGTYVSIPKAEGKKTITKHYMSPLSDVKTAGEILTKLFAKATLKEEPEIPARININTAPKEVLSTLVEITNLTDNDIEKIVSVRAGLTPEALRNPTWLLTEATIEIAKLRGAPGAELAKYLTTVTQVYRVQSVGYFEDKGPFYRIEAVIDTNAGRPRILAWRDLSELGKGLP